MVLAYHADASWIGGGYLGVSTFFTLSGFLITSLLLVEADATGRIDLARFWGRRLRRLMPAALLGIALALTFAVLAGTRTQLWRMRWDGLASLLYFANFRFMTLGHSYWELFNRPSPLQHYWSLSIEEQFYVVYPLLLIGVAALARRGRAATTLVLVVLAVVSTALMIGLSLAEVAPSRLYYGTDTRAAEFLVGAVLATLIVRGGRIEPWRGRGFAAVTLVAAVYIVAAIVLVEEDSPFLYRGGFALYGLASAVLINAALEPGLVRTILSWQPLRLLGVISYGVYVYHWPIYLWLDWRRTGLFGVELFALRVAVTLVVAVVSYVALERPIRERRRLRKPVARFAAPVAAAAVAGLILSSTIDAPPPRRPITGELAKMPEFGAPYPEGPLRVLVVGDSVAANIGGGFYTLSLRNPGTLAVWNLATYGCGVVRNSVPRTLKPYEQSCESWPDRWEAAVVRFHPDLAVVLTGLWDLRDIEPPGADGKRGPGSREFDSWVLREYQLAVDILSSRGARVVWLTAPCVGPAPRRNPLRGTGALEPGRLQHLNRVILPELAASRSRSVVLFDLFGTICPDGEFLEYDSQSRRLRVDYVHIARDGALQVADAILQTTFPDALQKRESPAVNAAMADSR